MKQKHYITLDEAIHKELKEHPELKEAYEEELLINAISRMIVTMRRKAKLTQAELAHRAHTAQSVIARLESGRDTRMPSLGLLARIATAAKAKLKLNFEMEKERKR
jgi:ribosome-binding protein aMBF1 (putative translation factor)